MPQLLMLQDIDKGPVLVNPLSIDFVYRDKDEYVNIILKGNHKVRLGPSVDLAQVHIDFNRGMRY